MNLEDSSPARACWKILLKTQTRRTTRAMKNTRDKRKSFVNVVHLLSFRAHNNLRIMRVVSWLPNYQYTGTWGGEQTGTARCRNLQVMKAKERDTVYKGWQGRGRVGKEMNLYNMIIFHLTLGCIRLLWLRIKYTTTTTSNFGRRFCNKHCSSGGEGDTHNLRILII